MTIIIIRLKKRDFSQMAPNLGILYITAKLTKRQAISYQFRVRSISDDGEIANHNRKSTLILLEPFLAPTTEGVDRAHHHCEVNCAAYVRGEGQTLAKLTTRAMGGHNLTRGPACLWQRLYPHQPGPWSFRILWY